MNNIKEKIIDDFLDDYSDVCNKHKMFIGATSFDSFCILRVCQDERRDAPAISWDSKEQKFVRAEKNNWKPNFYE
jgi:hypothetical protein